MKIIHTSDWHIGCRLYDCDRAADHRDALARLVGMCVLIRPDALLVSGDLCDNDHPSASDQRLIAETFARLHSMLPEMAIVAIAGNHDSPSRHESHAAIYEAAGVTMAGRLTDRGEDWPGRFIVDAGSGVIVTIPFYLSAGTDTGELLRAADRLADGRPLVVMAHTAIAGSDITGHDARIIGSLEACDADSFLPSGSYDYLALGHIHRPQTLGAAGRVRYSGALIPVSFDESYPHSISVVTIASRGATPEINELEIKPERPLVTLPSVRKFFPWNDALEALRNNPADLPAYIRLNVSSDSPLPASAYEDARRAAAGKDCVLCHINVSRSGCSAERREGMSVEELRMASPIEVIESYAASIGASLDRDLLDEVVNKLTTDNPDYETA